MCPGTYAENDELAETYREFPKRGYPVLRDSGSGLFLLGLILLIIHVVIRRSVAFQLAASSAVPGPAPSGEELVGAVGFEPTNGGSKGRCLTIWRRPRNDRL